MAECLEHKTKSKIGKTFANEKILEEYSVKVYEIDSYFYEHYKKKTQKKNKPIEMDAATYCLELMLRIKKHQKKNFSANSSELIQAIVIKIMKLVEYKHLLVSLKTDNQKSQKKNQTKR